MELCLEPVDTRRLGDDELRLLALNFGVAKLAALKLRQCPVTDEGLRHLSIWSSYLRQLTLDWCKGVTGAGLEDLATLTHLTELGLGRTGVTDDGLVNLAGLPDLRDLDLSYTGVTDAGLPHLAEIPGLGALNLGGTGITDAGLPHLAEIPGLGALKLGGTGITDAGVEHFARFTRLTGLDLSCTGVTDAGLAHFADLTHLPLTKGGFGYRGIFVQGCEGVTHAGVVALRAKLPECEIIW